MHVVCINQNVEKGAYWRGANKKVTENQRAREGTGEAGFYRGVSAPGPRCRHSDDDQKMLCSPVLLGKKKRTLGTGENI